MAPQSKRTTAGAALLPGAGRADKSQVVLHPATLQILEEQTRASTQENATLLQELSDWKAKAQNFEQTKVKAEMELEKLQRENAVFQSQIQSLQARRDQSESQRLIDEQEWEAYRSQMSEELEALRGHVLPKKHHHHRHKKELHRKGRHVEQEETEAGHWQNMHKEDLLKELARAQNDRDVAKMELEEVKAAVNESERQVEELTQTLLGFEFNLEDQQEKHNIYIVRTRQAEQQLREEITLQQRQWEQEKRSYENALQTNLNDAEGKKAHFQWLTQQSDEANYRARMLEQQAEQITLDMNMHQQRQIDSDDQANLERQAQATTQARLEHERATVAALEQEVAQLQKQNQQSTAEHLNLQETHARALLQKSNREANALLDAYPESDTDSGLGEDKIRAVLTAIEEGGEGGADSPELSISLQPSLVSEGLPHGASENASEVPVAFPANSGIPFEAASEHAIEVPVEIAFPTEGLGLPLEGAGTGLRSHERLRRSHDQLVRQVRDAGQDIRGMTGLPKAGTARVQSAWELDQGSSNTPAGAKYMPGTAGSLQPFSENVSAPPRPGSLDSHASGFSKSSVGGPSQLAPRLPSSLSSSSTPSLAWAQPAASTQYLEPHISVPNLSIQQNQPSLTGSSMSSLPRQLQEVRVPGFEPGVSSSSSVSSLQRVQAGMNYRRPLWDERDLSSSSSTLRMHAPASLPRQPELARIPTASSEGVRSVSIRSSSMDGII
eukprot:gnl/MRDRNA2_/MRDRNA2_107109_c0_seq1.p1 gnl/MRDRNA2_/MRDRNA2_107109_c0~~gnl/MRDRNA2_/MRDRNA2_107109_c0_seq1.p1  ORF type:complete len:740 (+),score=160.68 gnl/MRDRNA2_/MRDRNA2_107109_c0_seq1:44-2221(+)